MWAFNEAMEATSQVPCVLFISDTCHMSDPNPHLFPPLPTSSRPRTHKNAHIHAHTPHARGIPPAPPRARRHAASPPEEPLPGRGWAQPRLRLGVVAQQHAAGGGDGGPRGACLSQHLSLVYVSHSQLRLFFFSVPWYWCYQLSWYARLKSICQVAMRSF